MGKLELIEKHITVINEIAVACNGTKLSTVKRYRDIIHTFNAYKSQGANTVEAVTWTADDFDTTEGYIYRAISFFYG